MRLPLHPPNTKLLQSVLLFSMENFLQAIDQIENTRPAISHNRMYNISGLHWLSSPLLLKTVKKRPHWTYIERTICTCVSRGQPKMDMHWFSWYPYISDNIKSQCIYEYEYQTMMCVFQPQTDPGCSIEYLPKRRESLTVDINCEYSPPPPNFICLDHPVNCSQKCVGCLQWTHHMVSI